MDDEPDQRPEGRTSRRVSKTHEQLLAAALFIFNSKGVDGCSIEDITTHADLGKGTFYRHFMDKMDALQRLLQRAVGDLVARMPAPGAAALSLEDRINQLMTAHMTFFSERPDLFKVLLQGQTMVATRGSAVTGIMKPFTDYHEALEQRLLPALPAPGSPAVARRMAAAIVASACGAVTAGLASAGNKNDVMNNLDLARQSILAATSLLQRCAV